jgi:hypothetical protein
VQYWAIVLEKAQKLHSTGVRGIAVEVHYSSRGERIRGWTAWGPDGLPADWGELAIEEALADMARVVEPEVSGVSYLPSTLRGTGWSAGTWRRGNSRRWKCGGETEEPVRSRFDHTMGRPLRERLGYLVARYSTWYRHEAPRAWRERYGSEPTLEALLAWGKGRGEWGVLEEPLVPGLLREVLERRWGELLGSARSEKKG